MQELGPTHPDRRRAAWSRSCLALCSPTRTEHWTTSREARIPAGHVIATEFGQALVTVGNGWEWVHSNPDGHRPCCGQIAAGARQSCDHAYRDLRRPLSQGLGAGKPAA